MQAHGRSLLKKGTPLLAWLVLAPLLDVSVSMAADAYCGANDQIPNCRLIDGACAGSFESVSTVTTSSPDSDGNCGYGQLRAETIDKDTGRRLIKCLDASGCTGTQICKQVSKETFEITFKCLKRKLSTLSITR